MVESTEIVKYVDAIAEKFRPDRIILFGSYAEGRASDESDVDLLVEMDHQESELQQALSIRRSIDRSFPLDLMVKSSSEIQQRLRQNDYFLKNIMDCGQVLYERAG